MQEHIIERPFKDQDPLSFTIEVHERGKTIADVQDISLTIKLDVSDADDAYVHKRMSVSGEMTVSGVGTLTALVPILSADWDTLTIGTIYEIRVLVKWTGQTRWDEKTEQMYQFRTTQNFMLNA